MPADILAMKPRDPREQQVLPDGSVECAPFFALCVDSIRVQADRNAPPRCAGCGELNYLHYDTSGCFWIGCTGALRRKELGLMEREDQEPELHGGDRHPQATAQVRRLLQTSCSYLTELFNELPIDQQTVIARRLANGAMRGHYEDGGE